PELRDLIAGMSDEDIDRLHRGGHDPLKIYAAYRAALQHQGQPTVILAQTKKGYGMGHWGQGKMGTHQQKKLDDEALREFRDRFAVPLSDEDVAQLRFLHPAPDSLEMKYLHARRQALGGYLPARSSQAPKLAVPPLQVAPRNQSTTMAFVQILAQLMKDPAIGKRVVPIVADEARTFGMQTLFRQFGIYSSLGQLYEPEDHEELLYYREAQDGQILEEGITEAGAVSSWLAAATAYSAHGTPMLPFYIYYSMFGFQRIGDLVWAAGDSRARGFLIGGTAGRTTLAGEGLQHQDGHSHLAACTIPNCRAYDPCFGYELAAIVEDGARRMLDAQEDVFYYVTVANENYPHPPAAEGVAEGIRRGMYTLRQGSQLQLLGSGPILREVMAAADLLAKDWNVSAGLWSVTSFTELRRDGMQAERARRFGTSATSWVERCLAPTQGPVIAASDYVRAVADLIRPYVPRQYIALGTDGFGRSDTRAALRAFFEVDARHICIAALAALDPRSAPAVRCRPRHLARAAAHRARPAVLADAPGRERRPRRAARGARTRPTGDRAGSVCAVSPPRAHRRARYRTASRAQAAREASLHLRLAALANRGSEIEHFLGEDHPIVDRAHYGRQGHDLHAERTHAIGKRRILDVEHEAVDDAQIFAGDRARGKLATELAHHLACRAAHPAASDQRRLRHHRHAAPADQAHHAVDFEDRPDRVIGIRRADHHRFQVCGVQRIEHLVRNAREIRARVLEAAHHRFAAELRKVVVERNGAVIREHMRAHAVVAHR